METESRTNVTRDRGSRRRELRFRCLSRWHDARGTCSGTAEWLQLLGLGVEERDPS